MKKDIADIKKETLVLIKKLRENDFGTHVPEERIGELLNELINNDSWINNTEDLLIQYLTKTHLVYTFDAELRLSGIGEVFRWREDYKNIIEGIITIGHSVLAELNYSIFVEIKEYSDNKNLLVADKIKIGFELFGKKYDFELKVNGDWADTNNLLDSFNHIIKETGENKKKVWNLSSGSGGQDVWIMFGNEDQMNFLKKILNLKPL